MKVDFSIVCAPHPHTQKGRLARTESGSFCWDKDDPNESQYAVLATTRRGLLIGIQKFDVRLEGGKTVLLSGATFVWPMYRELKIGKKMWAKALTDKKITEAQVHVVSDRGKTLVESLRRTFPAIRFELCDNGKRRLRSLKGSKGKGKVRKAA